MKRNVMKVLLCTLLMAALVVAPVSASAAKKVTVISILKVNAEGARVRLGPSSEYGVITSLDKGDKVFYLNQTEDAFCLVRTAEGDIGYIYRGFLQAYGAARLDQIYYATQYTKVYKQPRAGSSRVATLSANDHLLVYMTSGEWALVKTLEGKGGFVKLSAITPAVD